MFNTITTSFEKKCLKMCCHHHHTTVNNVFWLKQSESKISNWSLFCICVCLFIYLYVVFYLFVKAESRLFTWSLFAAMTLLITLHWRGFTFSSPKVFLRKLLCSRVGGRIFRAKNSAEMSSPIILSPYFWTFLHLDLIAFVGMADIFTVYFWTCSILIW